MEARLRQLLERFGPPRQVTHPEFPFWHLQTDGIWEIPDRDSLPKKKGGRSVSAATLRKLGVQGGLPTGLDQLLRTDPELIETAAVTLLNGHFPESFHTPIRDAVGLADPMALETRTDYGTTRRRKRDPNFRRAVLTAYERRCAVCDFDVRLDDDLLGLDAAHIKWHAAGGPDRVPNGLALCKLHHHALDRGAIGLTAVSGRGLDYWSPRNSAEQAKPSSSWWTLEADRCGSRRSTRNSRIRRFVDWHRREVFRGEPRTS